MNHFAFVKRQLSGGGLLAGELAEEMIVVGHVEFGAQPKSQTLKQRMFAANFAAEFVIALGTKFHDAEIFRRETADHFRAVMNRRRKNILGIVQIKSRVKSVFVGR